MKPEVVKSGEARSDGSETTKASAEKVVVPDQKPPKPSSNDKNIKLEKREGRDDWSRNERDGGESRDSNDRLEPPKKPTKTGQRKSKSSSSHNRRGGGGYHPDSYPYAKAKGPYPGMHGGPHGPPPSSGPYHPPPPPPHYSYPGPGGPPDHYRPPPPPHYHQMPPMHHHPSGGPPYGGPGGPYGPPPHSMGGRPHFHPYPAYHPGAPPMPYPPSMHSYPPHGGMSMASVGSETASASSKSKGSGDRKSSKSSSSSHKKRTIDGLHEKSMSDAQTIIPGAFAFRRTNSNASTSSTVTAGNNTSNDTGNYTEDSPSKRDRSSELPPLSYPSAGLFDDDNTKKPPFHRRTFSGASTASTLSVGGFSLSSYDGPRLGTIEDMMTDDSPIIKSSPKRRKGADSAPLLVDTGSDGTSMASKSRQRRLRSPQSIDATESSRFEQLSMDDVESKSSKTSLAGGASTSNLFLTLSTSPINHAPDVDATPISKNTTKNSKGKNSRSRSPRRSASSAFRTGSKARSGSPIKRFMDRPADTPTPPIPGGLEDSEMMTDEHTLNTHLRGQSFTPLPHLGNGGDGDSPTNTAYSATSNTALSAIAPQLSWSIAGDTPSLGDLAEWEEDRQQKQDQKRPGSTTSNGSQSTRDIVISPHSFSMWKEEHESGRKGSNSEGKDGDSIKLSVLTQHSDIVMADEGLSGTTTPLPILFDHQSAEERENVMRTDKQRGSSSRHQSHQHQHGNPDHIHHLFVTNGCRSQKASKGRHFWSNGHGDHHKDMHGPHGMPSTPIFASNDYRDEGFPRSPLHGERRDGPPDYFPSSSMFGHPGPSHDRVRNLRGRVPPGAHLAPMPIHIPPPVSSHHPLTSPMGIGPTPKGGMWSPHHGGMPPPLASPHHMSPLDMSQSKRKCVPLKPPIPSKFQGDIEKVKSAPVPEFTSLVNFPAHMSQKQAVNLPEGMRCCVMCGQACPCSTGNKKKNGGKSKDGSLAPRSSNGQDFEKSGGYAIIPTQNKGLCTLCDVNVWVVVANGLEIKWCKGCKNFRPWAAFGDKGLATKCLRCRERQREKYALQKEEKEKARLIAKAAKKA